ncbi:ribonuclease E activity regulator RraA [Salsuginibacillus kocurii]|uniref:ribonuclease E activity regulator RraA n=1 Tax=Salsuginibacillus kocurii TaxID=427078 RepID=UPI00035E1D24|nr:ribonuclease E activity regulator RraA [Salsuginibacillus kocurii]
MNVPTADICDKYPEQVQLASIPFHSYGKKQSFAGPIATVHVHEDNVLVEQALNDVPEGTVLVVDGEGSKACALMGDRLAAIAQDRSLAGVIINGCIRDSAEINDLDTGIFALGTNPFKSKKSGDGQRDVQLTFASLTWKPNMWVYADEDGILLTESKLQ